MGCALSVQHLLKSSQSHAPAVFLPGLADDDELGPDSSQHAALSSAVSSALAIAVLVGVAQAALLGGLGAGGLAVWGAGPGSSLHAGQARTSGHLPRVPVL